MAGTLTRRRFLQGFVVGSGMALMAACGQAPAPSKPEATSAPAKPAEAKPAVPAATAAPAAAKPAESKPVESKPAVQAKPAPGGTINVALSIPVDTMDPAQTATTMLNSADKLVFDGLTALDKDNNLLPSLATKWEVSGDGLTWTFTLRPNVKFHDGAPFNAQAVKVNFDRILDPANNILRRNVIQDVAEVIVKDDVTVQLRTAQPFGPMPWYVAHPGVAFHSPAAIEKYGKDVALNPVGAGPYKSVAYPSTDRLELVRNEDYWGEKGVSEKINFIAVPEDAARVAMLQAGEADLAVNVPTQLADRIKADPQLALLTGTSSRVAHLGFNMLKPLYQDVRVRQAFNWAVDKDTLVKSVMRGYAKIYPSPFTPYSFGYAEQYAYGYDVGKAKDLLAQAGWKAGPDGMLGPNGEPVQINVDTPINRYLLDQATTEAVVGYLKAVGINAVSKPMEFTTFWSTRRGPTAKEVTDMYYMAWADPNGDLSYALQTYESRTWAPGNNFGFYKSEAVDRLATEGIRSTDVEKRKAAYKEIQKVILDDAPWVFLYALDTLAATRAELKGVQLSPAEYYLLASAGKGTA
jgi:glutathione transport system substrate-binding protein